MARINPAEPWYVAERNVERALDRAAAGQPQIAVAGSTVVMEADEQHFADAAQIAEHLAWLAQQPEVAPTAQAVGPPTVRLDGRRRHAVHHDDGAGGGQIRLPDSPWGRRQMTVLHEYAHHLTPGAGHGPEFCGLLVLLVRTAIGPSAALMLTEQLALHEVEIRHR